MLSGLANQRMSSQRVPRREPGVYTGALDLLGLGVPFSCRCNAGLIAEHQISPFQLAKPCGDILLFIVRLGISLSFSQPFCVVLCPFCRIFPFRLDAHDFPTQASPDVRRHPSTVHTSNVNSRPCCRADMLLGRSMTILSSEAQTVCVLSGFVLRSVRMILAYGADPARPRGLTNCFKQLRGVFWTLAFLTSTCLHFLGARTACEPELKPKSISIQSNAFPACDASHKTAFLYSCHPRSESRAIHPYNLITHMQVAVNLQSKANPSRKSMETNHLLELPPPMSCPNR